MENYFGRLRGLWRICANKFRWIEKLYDDIFHVCASLTNYHITLHPLHEENGEGYRQHCKRQVAIGHGIRTKRRMCQEKYWRNKRLRHTMHLDHNPGDDDFSGLSTAKSSPARPMDRVTMTTLY
ncbi:hypothetical protein PRNP1_000054 [Phytophthora ramorum]